MKHVKTTLSTVTNLDAIEADVFAKDIPALLAEWNLDAPLHLHDFGGGNTVVPVPDTVTNGTYLNSCMISLEGVLRYGKNAGKLFQSVFEFEPVRCAVPRVPRVPRRGLLQLPAIELKAALRAAAEEFLAAERESLSTLSTKP
jgi:hypothetical protein